MLTPESFAEELDAICTSGPPSDGDNLLGMEIDFMVRLGDPTYADDEPELWTNADVRRTDGDRWLLRGSARARPDASADEVAGLLAKIWSDDLRYGYREAHSIEADQGSVTLRAVTQISPGGFWVTAEVRVQLSV